MRRAPGTGSLARGLLPGAAAVLVAGHAVAARRRAEAASRGLRTRLQAVQQQVAAEQQQLQRSERHSRDLFESSPLAKVLIDASGHVLDANPAMSGLTGLSPRALQGIPVDALLSRADAGRLAGLLGEVRRGGTARAETEVALCHADGSEVVARVHATPFPGDRRRLLLGFVDFTERKRYERRLLHLADHDPLTGLLNRRAFAAALEAHLDRVRRDGPRGAVLLLDLDDFKRVNDALGHGAGDELLTGVAAVLSAAVRQTDVVARLGGDEFAVLLPDAGRDEADAAAQHVLAAVRGHVARPVGGRPRSVSASVGVVAIEEGAVLDVDRLLADADLAMYDAKEAGRDRAVRFRDGAHEGAAARSCMAWVDCLEEALAEGRFALLAQPIVDLATGAVVQHELLVRMVAADGDLIPPRAFLPTAERHGLVGRLDGWVVGRAIELLAACAAHGDPACIAVNVSGRSLGDEALLADVVRRLGDRGADPSRLVVEITETAAVADLERARRFAEQLRAAGCRLALDDFGSGFGTFRYLKHLPFDFLKIDGEFVEHCVGDRTDLLVIASLVGLARGLGKRTIAEFVSDEPTRELLGAMGVDLAQGHHIGRPLPLWEAFPGVVDRSPSPRSVLHP